MVSAMMMHAYRCSGKYSSKERNKKTSKVMLCPKSRFETFLPVFHFHEVIPKKKDPIRKFEKKGVHVKMAFNHYRP